MPWAEGEATSLLLGLDLWGEYSMRNIWLVIKHDIGVTLRQRSFWIFTFLVPVILLALNIYNVIESDSVGSSAPAAGEEATPEVTGLPAIGLVDEANLIAEMPPGFPEDLFVRFPDQAAARSALEDGTVEQYVYLPADYVRESQIEIYDLNFQIMMAGEGMGVAPLGGNSDWVLPYIINYNLVDDEQLLVALRNPVPGALAEYHALRPPVEAESENQDLARVVGTVLPYIYYFLLIMGGNYLMRSVVVEKENRTAEVLLLSVHPRKLMIGKMLAMSVVMGMQLIVWVGGGILILNRGADLMNVAQFLLPAGVWGVGNCLPGSGIPAVCLGDDGRRRHCPECPGGRTGHMAAGHASDAYAHVRHGLSGGAEWGDRRCAEPVPLQCSQRHGDTNGRG